MLNGVQPKPVSMFKDLGCTLNEKDLNVAGSNNVKRKASTLEDASV